MPSQGIINMPSGIYSPPVFSNGVLYIAIRNRLYAIEGTSKAKSTGQVKKAKTRNIPRGVPRPIYVSTPHDVVAKMLELAKVSKTDVVVDLGSGDGRIVITAAKKYGAKAIGFEIDGDLVRGSRKSIEKQKMKDLASIEDRSFYDADLSKTSVVVVLLYPIVLDKLKPQFAKMKPGSRIVSHHFSIPGVKPDKVVTMKSAKTGREHRILLYSTPLR